MAGVITASEPSWTVAFTGLSLRQFSRRIAALRREGADPVCKGRHWSLPLEDRVLLVAACRRTNLTLRQLAPLFGVSSPRSAASLTTSDRFSRSSPVKRFAKDAVRIVESGSRSCRRQDHHER
ncbi:hypothetical protein Sros01_36870 [Streptomyces roseochromogenus]|nr:hypothetical protein Sros01_36870 [Streptomyces roseochromogenus]